MALYLDFSKAFDVISNEILLYKLQVYGIRGKELRWFQSYLSNRKIYVNANGLGSEIRNVPTGVPQGATLAGLLFIIFLNDFYTSHKLDSINYADDSTVLYRSSDIDLLYSTFNENLKNIYLWLNVNKVKLNKDKSKFMVFSNSKQHHVKKIRIGSTEIEKINNVKLLGIWIDDKLNYVNHIKYLTKKLSYVSYILSQLYNLPKSIRKKIYYSFGHSLIMYGISIWGSAYKVHLKPLKRVHKNIVKKISGHYNSTIQAFKNIDLLSIEYLKEYSLLNFMHKIIAIDRYQI